MAEAARHDEVAAFADAFSAAGSALQVVRQVLRHPVTAARTVAYIHRLPTRTIALSDSPMGRRIGAELGRTKALMPTGRVARSVLEIPAELAAYPRGRRRQALRTNLRRADALGLTVHRSAPDAEFMTVVDELLRERASPTEKDVAQFHIDHHIPDEAWAYVVRKASGDPLVFMVLHVDVQCAWLDLSMIGARSEEALIGRYAVYQRMVADLHGAGVRYLLADNGLAAPAAVRYFQQRVGHEHLNLRVTTLTTARAD